MDVWKKKRALADILNPEKGVVSLRWFEVPEGELYDELLKEISKHKDAKRWVEDPSSLYQFLIKEAQTGGYKLIGRRLRKEKETKIGRIVRYMAFAYIGGQLEDALEPEYFGEFLSNDYMRFKHKIGALADMLSEDLRAIFK